MKKLTLLVPAFVLGSSSLVFASPGTHATVSVHLDSSVSFGVVHSGVIVHDHRTQHPAPPRPVHVAPSPHGALPAGGWHDEVGDDGRRPWVPPARPLPAPAPVVTPVPPTPEAAWITLAAGAHFAADNRTFINVSAAAGPFDTLRITADGGVAQVREVAIIFADGTEQVVRNLALTLDAGAAPTASIELDLAGEHRTIKRLVVYGTGTDTTAFSVAAR